jgi:hypothetical protein
MDGKHDIPAHTWILALAVFVIGAFLGIAWEHSEMSGGLGILGLGDQKLQGEVTALRQELAGEVAALRHELASQRETIEALKAPKSSSTTPVAAPGDAGPKAKPHR